MRVLKLRDALRIARLHGCEVSIRVGTGEWKVFPPRATGLRMVLVNAMKKDAPCHLARLVDRLERLAALSQRPHPPPRGASGA